MGLIYVSKKITRFIDMTNERNELVIKRIMR